MPPLRRHVRAVKELEAKLRTALKRCAEDGVTSICGCVDERHSCLYLLRIDDNAVEAIEPVGANASFNVPHFLQAVAEVINAALAEHDVVVQFLAQAFPEL